MDAEQAAIKKVFCLIPAVSMAFFKPFEQHNSHPGLSRSHIRTLIKLRLDGPSSMTHLSQQVELEKGSFTPVARHLEESGYLERVKPPEDRRQALLSLTAEGMRVADDLMAAMEGFERLFQADPLPVRWLRNTGLKMVDAMPEAKALFVREALGLIGDLPALAKA